MKYITLLLAVTVTACGNSNIDDAKNAVRMRLNDPSSAEFSQVNLLKDGVVCGAVNAKNRMGGYVGPKVFIYTGLDKNQVKLDASSSDIDTWCKSLNPISTMAMLEKMCKDALNSPSMAAERVSICGNKEKFKKMLPDM